MKFSAERDGRLATKQQKDGVHFDSALEQELNLAKTGIGSGYMNAKDALAFSKYCLSFGFGVSKMEAYGEGVSRGKHALYHQILGLDDDEENWSDHRNPQLALSLLKHKLRQASEDGLTLKYKLWVDVP